MKHLGKYSFVNQVNLGKREHAEDMNESVDDVKKRIEDMPMPQLGMEVPGLDDLITSESKFYTFTFLLKFINKYAMSNKLSSIGLSLKISGYKNMETIEEKKCPFVITFHPYTFYIIK